ncbi:MAG: TIR domain-containing protein [Chloroflexota bacterium]
MGERPVIYLAVATADLAVADVILAHLKHYGYRCIDIMDVPNLLNIKSDLLGTMTESDVIIVVDSQHFRQQRPNYELQFAQQLEKPLIVISLHRPVDETQSSGQLHLFDFRDPHHRDWQRLIDTIVTVTEDTTRLDDDFLF